MSSDDRFKLFDNVEDAEINMKSDGRLVGNDLDNGLTGSAHSDAIFGRKGDDLIVGRAGDDMIHGGRSRDTISGGGDDEIRSGGPDLFVFNDGDGDGHATIRGYDRAVDALMLRVEDYVAEQGGDDVVVTTGGGDTVRITDISVDNPEVVWRRGHDRRCRDLRDP